MEISTLFQKNDDFPMGAWTLKNNNEIGIIAVILVINNDVNKNDSNRGLIFMFLN